MSSSRKRVYFTPEFLGCRHSLVVDATGDEFVTSVDVDRPLDNAWIVDVEEFKWCERDARALLRIADVALDDARYPGESYVKMGRALGITHDVARVQWAKLLPSWRVEEMACEVARDILSVSSEVDGDYYIKHFAPSRRFLSSLAPAHIDATRLESYIGSNVNNSVLKTFVPNSRGFVCPPTYDVVGTRTGRLRIVDGPRITTLDKRHRDIITSRFDGGKIMSLDFRSFEAKIAMAIAGHDTSGDVYTRLGEVVLGGVSRGVAKSAILATLYGAGAETITKIVGQVCDVAWLIDAIRDYFKLDETIAYLYDDYDRNGGFIRNMFGRRVACRRADNIIYNSYVQSTGVDVAMSGFAAVIERIIASGMSTKPLFVVHDALVLDVPSHEVMYIDELCDVCSNSASSCVKEAKFDVVASDFVGMTKDG